MVAINHSYKSIAEAMQDPVIGNMYLNKEAVINRMVENLPLTPWANIGILDWLPEDDTLSVEYFFYNIAFGKVLAANTSKGICYVGLVQNDSGKVLADFKKRFSYTNLIETETLLQSQVIHFLDGNRGEFIPLHIRGTAYQTEIWRKLIRIPYGKVISYTTLGGSAVGARAAGTANGRNPVFWIVPCHRVVKTTGSFDRYFWGEHIKRNLLAWEFSNTPDL